MRNLICILFICLINSSILNGSNSDSIFVYAGIQSHYGFIIPHSAVIKDISHTRPYGFEINYSRLHTSYNDWRIFNAYWISGFESGYFNFQNPDILGSIFEIGIFAEPILRYRRNRLLSIRGGAGFSYHGKIYDEIENPLNHFFSSRIAFPLYVDLRLKQRIASNCFLTLSGCYNHISNGGFKLPNKGMNFPTLALGIEIYQKKIPNLQSGFSSGHKEKINETLLNIQLLTSVKVLGKTEDLSEKPAFIIGFHSRVSRRISPFYALNAGAECIFDYYIKETIQREQSDLDFKRLAVTVGQDFLLGKIIFTQYFGAYIYSPYTANHKIYQKYELLYHFSNKFLMGVFLKAHLHVAELMGLSFNYKLKLNKD